MYVTVVRFKDLQDDKHLYRVGDEYPRSGLSVSDERLLELSTNKNRRGVPLIEEQKKSNKEKETAEIKAETAEITAKAEEETTTPSETKKERKKAKKAE